jgi:fumarylpyruvate hydrolase
MTEFIVAPPPQASLPVAGTAARFPVRRVYCVGRNYLAHVREMNGDERDPPFFFQKPADAVMAESGAIPYPLATEDLHHEVEMVAAIGVAGSRIAEADALAHVWGYGVGIDLTRRDLQAVAKEKRWPWEMGKAFDHAAPMGALTPVGACGHGTREISLEVDGETRQRSTTDHMIWSVAEIIAKLSEQYRLEPGDLIMTGTPEGVSAVTPGATLTARCSGLESLEITIGPRAG